MAEDERNRGIQRSLPGWYDLTPISTQPVISGECSGPVAVMEKPVPEDSITSIIRSIDAEIAKLEKRDDPYSTARMVLLTADRARYAARQPAEGKPVPSLTTSVGGVLKDPDFLDKVEKIN